MMKKMLAHSAMSWLLTLVLMLCLALAGATVLTGCGEPGPAEEAGQEVDDLMEDVKDEVEDVIED